MFVKKTVLLWVCVAVLFVSQPVLAQAPSNANSLIAHYALDGNADDSSIYGNDGFWVDPAAEDYNTDDPAIGSGSAVFSGTDGSYIDVGTGAAPNPQMADNYAQGSVSFWFKTTSDDEMSVMGVTNNGTASAFNIAVNHGNTAGRMAVYIRSEGGGGNVNLQANGGSGVVDGQWHHVAIVWGEDTAADAYIDGVLVESWSRRVADSPWLAEWDYPVLIGARNNRGTIDNLFVGELDDIKLFNYRLTEQDVIDELVAGPANWVCEDRPEYDLTGDCLVGLADFALLAEEWLECGRDPEIYCP